MRTPTHEQQAVLDSTARIRVVRASPGSGKTTLVGMIIRQELENWRIAGGGIVALSFTRVGGNEIRRELGYELDHPHFVGTLDAFLFKYVVRPFLRQVHPDWERPRLIPADWDPHHWGKRPGGTPWEHRGNGGRDAKQYNLFSVCFIDEDANGPVLAYPRPYRGGIDPVATNDRAGLYEAKRQSWKDYGWLTHADVALLASEFLNDPTHGATIRTLILKRFPLLIVDELQDTGLFLGKCIQRLLDDQNARSVLVGDPNQAIYEFNGARPALFNRFETTAGATRLPLGNSRRCGSRIVSAATHVKETDDPFNPVTGLVGRAFLVRYTDMVNDAARLSNAVRAIRSRAEIKIVVRWNSTKEELTSGKAREVHSLRKPAITHMCRAVQAFRQCQNVLALACARAALELAVFGHEGVTDEELANHKIEPQEWKALAVRCLMKCNSVDSAIPMQQWQVAAGLIMDETIQGFGLPTSLPFTPGRLRPNNLSGRNRTAAGADALFSEFAPIDANRIDVRNALAVQTVHGVKGETHDVTVFIWPPTSTHHPCPSQAWWPADIADAEERRIAYVAMTRTRGDLVVCVSEDCYQRLCQARAEFVASFNSVTVDEFIAAF